MQHKLLFSILLFLSVNYLFAQDEPKTNSFQVPSAPTAAALGKYGDIPVSLYTGTPSINVPIYELKSRDLSVPISLSYHASGVRVQDQGSWVGTGWSLNASGVISRTLRGKADEMRNGFANLQQTERGQLEGLLDGTSTMTPEQKRNFLTQINGGEVDAEPDIFNFNFQGNTGKFVFDMDGNVHLISERKIKIVPTIFPDAQGRDVIQSFTITDESGIRYEFGKPEISGLGVSSCSSASGIAVPNPAYFYSAWQLTKIISPLGNTEVTFTYEPDQLTYDVNVSQSSFYGRNGLPYGNISSSCAVKVTATVQRLTSIQGALGRVELVPDAEFREDLKGGKRLKEIKVYDGTNPSPVKKFTLEYFYAQNASMNCFSDWDAELLPYYQKRLFLSQVKEGFDPCGENIGYAFEYNNPNQLPPRYSCAVDYWGFYNGKTNNQSFVPKLLVWMKDKILNNSGDYNVGQADREPNGLKASTGILTKITYPTGGYTTFDFEPNYSRPIDPPGVEIGNDLDVDFYRSMRNTGGVETAPATWSRQAYARTVSPRWMCTTPSITR